MYMYAHLRNKSLNPFCLSAMCDLYKHVHANFVYVDQYMCICMLIYVDEYMYICMLTYVMKV